MQSLRFHQQQKLALNQRIITGLQILQMPQAAVEQLITDALSDNPLLTLADGDAAQHPPFSPSVSAVSADDWLDQVDLAEQSLQQHLLWQLETSTIAASLVPIVQLLIDSIDEDGYLSTSLESLSEAHDIPLSTLQTALSQLQTFDPSGVGARDLMECLRLQLTTDESQPPDDQVYDTALALLSQPSWLSDYPQSQAAICQTLDIDVDICDASIRLIRGLNPKPGLAFSTDPHLYQMPDLIVSLDQDDCQICTKATRLLQINTQMLAAASAQPSLMKTPDQQAETAAWLREQKTAGETLIQAIQYRFDTLSKVATYLRENQAAYFSQGLSALRPMLIIDVAEALSVSASTISRAATHKIIQSPQGTETIRQLFSPPLPNQPHLTVRYAQQCLRQIIRSESPQRPLSDAQLVAALSEYGIALSRRTITKYRLAMRIGNSRQRKIR